MKNRLIILVTLLAIGFSSAIGQIRTDPFYPWATWSVGGGAGFSELYGNLNHSSSEPVYMLNVARNPNMWTSLNLELMHGAFSDYEVKNTWTNGLHVYNQFTAVDLNAKVSLGEFFKYPQSLAEKILFGIYGGVGVGFMSNNVSNITKKFKFQDKYLITDYNATNIKTSSTNFFIPFNLGMNLHVTRRFFVNVNYQFSYALSDYLDGYNFQAPYATNKYNDMFSVLSIGLNFYLGKVGYGEKKHGYEGGTIATNWIYAVTPAERKQLEQQYDSDGDGVPDVKDKCPGTPAGVKVDANGCPLDRDGDGIPDYLDKCPDVKGTAALQGCPEGSADPDTDGDGVPDSKDKCPGTPAGVKVDANGCPLDRDGDGVPDYLDKCPDVKGAKEANGCPVVNEKAKKILDQALQGIQFETAKDIIRPSSYSILDNVVKVMKDNPSYNLQINGYTDNKGKPEANQKLSEKRATAVMNYLINHGVESGRLKAAGYGQEKPIADNGTEEGRKQNRRVELIVNF